MISPEQPVTEGIFLSVVATAAYTVSVGFTVWAFIAAITKAVPTLGAFFWSLQNGII